VKRRALERHLEAHRCVSLREGGKHSIWENPTGSRASLPRHNEIGKALVAAICKQLEVPNPLHPKRNGGSA
jgi:mRNA interferase HicA